MKIKRRRFLQSILAGGGVIASNGLFADILASHPSSTAPKQLLIKGGTVFDNIFAQGLAIEQRFNRELRSDILSSPAELQHLISSKHGWQLVGLMQDSHFLLLHELVRSASGRVLYTGQHCSDNIGEMRHMIMTSKQMETFATSLGRKLLSIGDQVTLNQRHLGRLQSRDKGNWPELVGESIKQFGSLGVKPLGAESIIYPQKVSYKPSKGSFVSFVFDV